MQKRRQHPLPGLYDTAIDAAYLLAAYEKLLKEGTLLLEDVLAKQTKERKPRKQPVKPAAAPPPPKPVQSPMVTAMAVPAAMFMRQRDSPPSRASGSP